MVALDARGPLDTLPNFTSRYIPFCPPKLYLTLSILCHHAFRLILSGGLIHDLIARSICIRVHSLGTMQPGPYSAAVVPTSSLRFRLAVSLIAAFVPFCRAVPSVISVRNSNPLNIDLGPAPSQEDGPPLSASALRDSAYLPAQIGGIVGAYAVSLVIVASVLLLLAKRRREHLEAGDDDEPIYDFGGPVEFQPKDPFESLGASPQSPIKNFSWPTPIEKDLAQQQFPDPAQQQFVPSPRSTLTNPTLGVNQQVDQRVVAADHEMAQNQLEEMYKYVMEQEDAKEAGVVLQEPPAPILNKQQQSPTATTPTLQQKPGFLRKGKSKPANLDLESAATAEKPQSRTASILSALRSPRKKSMRGISISSPIMTPMSGTFPRQEGEEMEAIPPRQYAPAPPPPVPTDQHPYAPRRTTHQPLTPEISPESTMSIDERLGVEFGHSRHVSQAPTTTSTDGGDPVSAVSERSTAPLVGLPSSPKPGARFPSLPASPRPGQTFQRAHAPSAVRTDGALPLRAYEPALASPSVQTTKQTVFERAPLSPSGLKTPFTGAAVPYSPYQPYTPVVPMTPSLVTKADRKRMKALAPKTPTLVMVKSSDEIW
jgi:hypothetical protein